MLQGSLYICNKILNRRAIKNIPVFHKHYDNCLLSLVSMFSAKGKKIYLDMYYCHIYFGISPCLEYQLGTAVLLLPPYWSSELREC